MPQRTASCLGGLGRLGLFLTGWAAIAPTHAVAAPSWPFANDVTGALGRLERIEVIWIALSVGLLVFAVVVAIALVRNRVKSAVALNRQRAQIAGLRSELDQAMALLLAEPQVTVAWRDGDGEPTILGDAAALAGSNDGRRLLAFGTWLDAATAARLESAVDALRERGVAFGMLFVSRRGRHIEADGRPIGGAAVLRLREVTGARLDYAALHERHARGERELGLLRALFDALPAPIWIRDADGQLIFVNRAYVAAVDATDAKDALARGIELMDGLVRAEAARIHAEGKPFSKRVPAVVAGSRRMLDVVEVAGPRGLAGLGIDATETEATRAELSRIVGAYRRTLDQLGTAVAIFGADERMVFHNSAYATLFELDPAFLDEHPTDSAVLDRLREGRKLPEQADFRAWKTQLFEAYRALEPKEHRWYLPDGRTLRTVTNPNPGGGVIYLFDDITERIDLESRFNALTRIQSETLEALAEAVAVFGSDGRLKLYNLAFARMWKLSALILESKPHVDTVVGWCRSFGGKSDDNKDPWQEIKVAVTRFDPRTPLTLRMERADQSVLDCATMPLPDGGTLITFRDVSDTVNFERALVERNEALLAADAVKNAFVHHVSYELRSPLTTIIGFAQLLDDPAIGPLSVKQREYVGHITQSSAALLAIINDILDLATIDAGAMQLELSDVNVRETMAAAAEGVRDRLAEQKIRLEIRLTADIGNFRADAKRVRQVLFNLLSNAIGFSPTGSTVTLSAERRDGAVIFRVTDTGPGIPPELKERVFDRFETYTKGSGHRGVGLGLSIVRSFVALHGGTVSIDSKPGAGTVVTCIFPPTAAADPKAAE